MLRLGLRDATRRAAPACQTQQRACRPKSPRQASDRDRVWHQDHSVSPRGTASETSAPLADAPFAEDFGSLCGI